MKLHRHINPPKSEEVARSNPISEIELIFSGLNDWPVLKFEERLALFEKIIARFPETLTNRKADIELMQSERYRFPAAINCFLNDVAFQQMEAMISTLMGCSLNPDYPKNQGNVLYQGEQYQLDQEMIGIIETYRSRLD